MHGPQKTPGDGSLSGGTCLGREWQVRGESPPPQPSLLSAPSSARTADSAGLGKGDEDGVLVGVPPEQAPETRGADTGSPECCAASPAQLAWLWADKPGV